MKFPFVYFLLFAKRVGAKLLPVLCNLKKKWKKRPSGLFLRNLFRSFVFCCESGGALGRFVSFPAGRVNRGRRCKKGVKVNVEVRLKVKVSEKICSLFAHSVHKSRRRAENFSGIVKAKKRPKKKYKDSSVTHCTEKNVMHYKVILML